jgi:DnaJ domain
MGQALRLAFDLMHFPGQVRVVRTAPLPADVSRLLQIAAGDEAVILLAASQSGRPPHLVREAAGFFIEQILLFPDADNYRVLGATPQASYAELRQNMALLLRWLHPDVNRPGERTVFVTRVTRAWNELKAPERRAAYDQLLRRQLAEGAPYRRKGRSGERRDERVLHRRPQPQRRSLRTHPAYRAGLLNRVLFFLFGRTVL